MSFNSKFHSFQVWILIWKDNTDNKVFKGNFIQRNKKERDRKDNVLQILSTICGNRSEIESRKQSSLNLSLFLFFFCFIEIFQSSLNFKFSLRFFSTEFSVEFSFSWISVVNFHLIWFYFLGSSINEGSDKTHLLT